MIDWVDQAVVLSARAHGETAALAVLFTREYGRHAGLVQGGQGRERRASLEPGTQVTARWRARLADHLGTWNLEPEQAFAAGVMDDPLGLAALSGICGLIEAALPEREPHPALFDATLAMLQALSGPVWAEILVRWELGLLQELGYGLDLSTCAATGSNDGLTHVSPRTGRAVSASAAQPYQDRLLRLPGFLIGQGLGGPEQVMDGLALSGHFLERHLFAQRHLPVPPARQRFVELYRQRHGSIDALAASPT